MVRLNTKDENMMVHAFRKGIVPGPFSESLIKSHPKTFGELRHRAIAHIVAKGELREAQLHSPHPPARAKSTSAHEGT